MMTSCSKDTCVPCSFRGSHENADVWCLVCKEGLCSSCHKHHKSSKALSLHGLISIEEHKKIPSIALSVEQICHEHNREFELYCTFHQEPCCIKCGTKIHKNCGNLTLLEDVVENVKSSVAMNNIEQGLDKIAAKVETIINEKEKNIRQVDDQTESIKEEIKNLRTAVNDKFNELAKTVLDELDISKTEAQARNLNVLEAMRKTHQDIEDIKVTLSRMKETASNLQIFLSMSELESLVTTKENSVSQSIEKGECDRVELKFEHSWKTEPLWSLLPERLGNVKILRNPTDKLIESLGCEQNVEENQQPEQKCAKDVTKIKLEKVREFSCSNLPLNTSVCNCVLLSNNMMVFTNYHSNRKMLFLHDCNGVFMRCVETVDTPYGVTVVKESIVAVTIPTARKVVFIDLGSNRDDTVKEFSTINACYGIDFASDNFIISIQGFGLQLTDPCGNVLKTLPIATKVICFNRENIYYAESKIVVCCDVSGKKIWEYAIEKLTNPRGVAVDTNGNTYVSHSGNPSYLFVISNDGKEHKILLENTDGLEYSRDVFFKKGENHLLFCKKAAQSALYKISQENT